MIVLLSNEELGDISYVRVLSALPHVDGIIIELRAGDVGRTLRISADELDQMSRVKQIDGNTSDGYHTFNELYEFRREYNAALFNEWAAAGKYEVHKSWKHSDGDDCFGGGWFVVVAQLPTGQITNHYEAEHWNAFRVNERDRATAYDGHSPAQVLERLRALNESNPPKEVM